METYHVLVALFSPVSDTWIINIELKPLLFEILTKLIVPKQ